MFMRIGVTITSEEDQQCLHRKQATKQPNRKEFLKTVGASQRITAIKEAFIAALPIVFGYIAIGIPCGILSASIGLSPFQVLLMCVLLYSGTGQFMLPNMYLASTPLPSIIASIALVNLRQMLYSASLSPYAANVSPVRAILFAGNVTDESFGINMTKFKTQDWDVTRATWVNVFSQTSWTISGVVGCVIGGALSLPLPVASFAMTSVFICLLALALGTREDIVAALFAGIGVVGCKVVGLNGPAIIVGSLIGLLAACVYARVKGSV